MAPPTEHIVFFLKNISILNKSGQIILTTQRKNLLVFVVYTTIYLLHTRRFQDLEVSSSLVYLL